MAKGLSAAQRRAVTGSDPATGRLSARPDVCAGLAARGLAVPHGRSGHHNYYLSPDGLRLRAELAAAAAPPPPAPASEAAGPAPGGGFVADLGTAAGPGVHEPGERTVAGGPGTEAAGDPAGPGGAHPQNGPDDGLDGSRRGDRPGSPNGVAPSGGPAADARRRAEVAAAWEGLMQIRALLLDGATDLPAPWERERRVHAVALALEAAGCPPARPDRAGYTVAEAAAQPGVIEVGWRDPAGPADQVRALTECARLLETHGWQCTRHSNRSGRTFLLASPRHG